MSNWIIRPSGLIEPVPVPEFYVDGCAGIEAYGACVRLHFYSEQMPLEAAPGIPQKVAVVKIVRPLATMPQTMMQFAKCMWPEDPLCMTATERKPHLVR